MKKYFAYIAAALMAGSLASCSRSNVNDPNVAPEGWVLEWEEQFDSLQIDSTVWSRINRGSADWNNYMTKADTCYAVVPGNLLLRGIQAFDGCNDTVPFLTGGVSTMGKKHFSRGRLDIRAKLKGAKGSWPAIWLLPDTSRSDARWPFGGEIDIMERLSHDTIAYQTVHSYYTLNLNRADYPPHGSTGAIHPDDYNTYSVELWPDSLRFLINNVHTFTYPRIETDYEGQFPFDSQFYLLIDMQLGGSWVGEVDPSQLPAEMIVDWVKFYRPEEGR